MQIQFQIHVKCFNEDLELVGSYITLTNSKNSYLDHALTQRTLHLHNINDFDAGKYCLAFLHYC